ncbi:hypothetical protein GF362_04535 [Candidatus Dojkabacteria bacterium]|nr:hypothetical protein [Candidatus Dojkabacteria bacterium]
MGKFLLNFKDSNQTQIKALIASLKFLAQGNHIKFGFIPCTDYYRKDPKTFVYPDIHYSNYKNIWMEVKNFDEQNLKGCEKIEEFLNTELDESKVNKKLTSDMKDFWRKIKSKFTRYIYTLYPKLESKDINIDVYVKNFSSYCSFCSPIHQGKKEIHGKIFVRTDMQETVLIEGIFSVLFHSELLENYSWEQKEVIIDHMTKSFLRSVDYKGKIPQTIKTLSKKIINKKLAQNSSVFLRKNKLENKRTISLNEKNKIEISNKPLTKDFFERDRKILKHFLDKENRVLTYDELADIMWGNKSTQKFSLSAINRHLSRLRKKLEKLGLPSSCILSVRGVGYYLQS